MIDAILDEGTVGHVGLCDAAAQPYVMPVVYARDGQRLYIHGSPLSRLLSGLAASAPICFTVTIVDGLVLARSAFHHSVNFRSVIVVGRATVIRDDALKRAALMTLVEHFVPGRADDVRGPSEAELAATEVVELAVTEGSAKVRTGPPVDAPEDYALPAWAGVLPFALRAGAPVADPRCEAELPGYLGSYHRGDVAVTG